ncbi:MAG: hypothetical protein J0H08_08485, partial [Rhizobiales bacterium]|nr:hypothetical protein [Hyphomicrobiales bacterium]
MRGAFETGAAGRIAANVEASRVDGGRGQLAARLQRASADAALMIDATVQEGQDGILLGLMGRADGPAYRLQAHTDIVDGAFDGRLDLVSDGDARFAGTFSLSPQQNAGQRLVLSGDGDLAELVPPALSGLLSGAIDVAVDVEWSQLPGRALPEIVVHQGRISTGAVKAEATGSLGATTSDLTLRLDVAAPRGGPLTLPLGCQPVSFDSITVSGRVA